MLDSSAGASLFKPGERVVHSIMGAGEVTDIDLDQAAYVVKFDELTTPRRISFKAKLEAEPGSSS